MRSDTVPLFFPCARNRERRVARCPSACRDRKSTRLNSSHSQISYAVFCLKKKKQPRCRTMPRNSSREMSGMMVNLGKHELKLTRQPEFILKSFLTQERSTAAAL